MVPRIVGLPLVPLASLAAWLASLGLDRLWLIRAGDAAAPGTTLLVAAALHAAWILPATRRAHPLLVGLAWSVTLFTCRSGLAAAGFRDHAFLCALVVETIILALALTATPADSWADRLARWRRARQNITTELRRADGLVPWVTSNVRRLIGGTADRPVAATFDRLLADLSEAEARLRGPITAQAMPEELRQALLTAAQALVSPAEMATARVAIGLEQKALEEAAACRDLIARLPDLPPIERERLGRASERLLLDLVLQPACAVRPELEMAPARRVIRDVAELSADPRS